MTGRGVPDERTLGASVLGKGLAARFPARYLELGLSVCWLWYGGAMGCASFPPWIRPCY